MRKFTLLLIVSVLTGCGTGGIAPSDERSSAPPVNCGGYVRGTSVSGDFLCAHNAARAAARPVPAKALPKLTWNAKLAAVAESYAKSCTWAHNPKRERQYAARGGDKGPVGENLYVSTYPNASPYDAVASWMGEARDYDYRKNRCDKGKVCGHYTQVVWRDTRQVGCGVAFCGKVSHSSLTHAMIMVCNYSPAGNYIGERPY